MSLQTRLDALISAIGADIKARYTKTEMDSVLTYNPIPNSRFDNGLAGWVNQAGSWDVIELLTSTTEVGAYSGRNVARALTLNAINARDTGSGGVRPIKEGLTYCFSYIAWTENGGGTGEARMSWVAGSGASLGSIFTAPITLTDRHQRLSIAGVAPAGAVAVRVGPRITPTTASGLGYASALMLNEGVLPMDYRPRPDEENKPPTYTVATRPAAATATGIQIYVSDAAAGAKMQYSDGAAWQNLG